MSTNTKEQTRTKVTAICKDDCPKCEEGMYQLVEIGYADGAYIQILGEPYCIDCSPNKHTGIKTAIPVWKIMPRKEREMIMGELIDAMTAVWDSYRVTEEMRDLLEARLQKMVEEVKTTASGILDKLEFGFGE
jgi:hypothetical protein